MKTRILIVEDELLVAQNMSNMLQKSGFTIVELVSNASDARRALEMYQVDIILLDIKLRGEEDGISLAHHIDNHYHIPTIFISSHVDSTTTNKALEAHPSAFLVKPYNERELQISINVALFNFNNKQIAIPGQQNINSSDYLQKQHVFVKDKNRLERLEYADILWMKAESSYVSITTNIKNYLLTSDTLGSLLERIDCSSLLRVHRSYAVNIDRVKVIDGNQLSVNTEFIPIGKSYRASVKQYFNIL